MPKCYFVFTDAELEGQLKNKAANGDFGLLDIEYMFVKDIEDFEEKGKAITSEDAVVYIDFHPQCERGRKISSDLRCNIRYAGSVRDLAIIDFKHIMTKVQFDSPVEVPEWRD